MFEIKEVFQVEATGLGGMLTALGISGASLAGGVWLLAAAIAC